ncbi:site-specific integrase [Frankia sp. CIT1]|uniref:tyrosine-type recombinase/integrase n=1 Tax=Frankia sp. CIT1 TaxID=2880974 RepID=UPI001EF6A2C6|nr:site-specific integrase [Frankia sp. CIT1]
MAIGKGNRRGHGEGSVYWREDRQRWVLEIDYGYVNGKRKRTVRYFRSQEEAIEEQTKVRTAQLEGAAPLDRRSRFDDFLDYWLGEVVEPSDRAESTKVNYSTLVRVHIRPALGRLRLVEMKHEDLQRFLNRKAAEGYSASTMRTLRTILRQALNEAVIMEKVSRNVAVNVRVPKATKPKRKVVALSQADGVKLLAAAESTRFASLYVVLAMVGLRRGEVLALRWSDFNERAATLRVEQQVTRVGGIRHLVVGPTKSEAGQRTIALPARCVAALQAQRRRQAAERHTMGERWRDHGLIFPSTVGTYLEPRALNTHLTKLCVRAGLPHLGPHGLRHTAATMAYALGVDWKQIQDMLGHTMLSTTMDIYVDMADTGSRDAATKLDAWFDNPDDQATDDDSETA